MKGIPMSKNSTAGKIPEIIYRNGKPSKVIIGIKEYEALLEAVEDKDALDWLKRSRKESKSYRPLEEVLGEIASGE
jgi:PHD/YefM family antitoxin component YafN of YafNO toxin-antitoxin module